MSKSKRRPVEKRPKGIVEHKSHRRNVKYKIKLGMFEYLPDVPRKSHGGDGPERDRE